MCIAAAIFHCCKLFFSPEFWLTITVFLFLLGERGTFCPTPRDMADPSLAVWTTKAISFYKLYAFFLCSIMCSFCCPIFKMDFVHVALYMRKLSKKLHSSLLRLRSATIYTYAEFLFFSLGISYRRIRLLKVSGFLVHSSITLYYSKVIQ